MWKAVVKKKKKPDSYELKSTKTYSGDVLDETARILTTQKENVPKTVKRFLEDIKRHK